MVHPVIPLPTNTPITMAQDWLIRCVTWENISKKIFYHFAAPLTYRGRNLFSWDNRRESFTMRRERALWADH